MRQLLIKKHANIANLFGETMEVRADRDYAMGPGGVTYITIPLTVEMLTGRQGVKFLWELPRFFVEKGLVLLGAYLENEGVVAALRPLDGSTVLVPKGSVVLQCSFVEVCYFRQVDGIGFTDGLARMPHNAKPVDLGKARPKKPRKK
ncbi:MAG: hypothetical protein ACREGB_01775 [Candidatus Saccharimonadales bacterium]